jgi:KAP family P-loop domain
MSLQNTKCELISALDDTDNKVIALSGKWGTGKTFLWNEIQKKSGLSVVKEAINVSMFGVSDIAELKLKLLVSATPDLFANASAQAIGKTLKDIGSKLSGIRDATLNEIALLRLPSRIANKLVVLDDIERMNSKLSANELLGFIDEFSKIHAVRFLVIQNTEKIENFTIWSVLREKVIDYECLLNTTPNEAFEIASKIRSSNYSALVEQATVICAVTNIRVILKTIKIVDKLLCNFPNLGNDVLSRVIPSIVLFSAIHLKSIANGPTFEFVLGFNLFRFNAEVESERVRKKANLTDVESMSATMPVSQGTKTEEAKKWAKLLAALGISSCDQFEIALNIFFSSGQLDVKSLEVEFTRYNNEASIALAQNSLRDFWDNYAWDWTKNSSSISNYLSTLEPHVKNLSAAAITSVYNEFKDDRDFEPAALRLVESWVSFFNFSSGVGFQVQKFREEEFHPKIKDAISTVSIKNDGSVDLLEACNIIASGQMFKPEQRNRLILATSDEYAVLFKSCLPKQLKRLVDDLRKVLSAGANFNPTKSTLLDTMEILKTDAAAAKLYELLTDCFSGEFSNLDQKK